MTIKKAPLVLLTISLLISIASAQAAPSVSGAQKGVKTVLVNGLAQLQVLPVSSPSDASVVLQDALSAVRFTAPLLRCQKQCMEEKQKTSQSKSGTSSNAGQESKVWVRQEANALVVEQNVQESAQRMHKIKSTWQWDSASESIVLARSEWILIGAQGPVGKNTIEHRSGVIHTQWQGQERQCALKEPKTVVFEWSSAVQLEALAKQTCLE